MRKKLIITITIFMIISILFITANSVYTNNDLSIVSKINTEVFNLFKIEGYGVPTIEGYKKVISNEEANCTQYAYVFARRAFVAGYDVKIIGITSNRNSHHVVVNVKISDRWYLFDPYNGIYYKSDAYDIIQNPDLVRTMVGTPKDSRKAYTQKAFFKEIDKIEIYENLNYAEKDLSHEATVIERSKFYQYPNDVEASVNNSTDTDYTAAVESTIPNFFVLKWNEPKEFYRVSIEWFNEENYASDFQILALVDGKYIPIIEEKNYKTEDRDYEKVIKNPVKTNQIKFIVNSTVGQDRLLLRRFSLYE